MTTTTSRPASGTATALRALADHLDQHHTNDTIISADASAWGIRIQLSPTAATPAVPLLLRAYSALDAPSITANVVCFQDLETVHLRAHGLIDHLPATALAVTFGTEAAELAAAFQLTTDRVNIPVHKLRALTTPALVTAAIHRGDETPGGAA